jgi:DNA topoisomerase-1
VDQAQTAAAMAAAGHSTTPSPRLTEATVVKALEERGIGRPSTYASIINTIQDRGYVWKRGAALIPSWVAFAVVGLMERHFGRLVDYDFTAAMEDELDGIAAGRAGRTSWLDKFYFGGDMGPVGSVARSGGLKKLVGSGVEEIDAREINSIPMFTDSDGRTVVVRVGRYGPYLERFNGEAERANLPEDLPPDELTPEMAEQLFAAGGAEGRSLGVDSVSGNEIVARDGRYGPYVTELLPDGAPKSAKPRTASLFKDQSLDTVTLDEALRLLSLPRVVGKDPSTGEEITAQNGRYGPYLKRGNDSRSLASEEQLFTVTLDEALRIYAEPKKRGRAAAASAAPLRELGTDPASGKPMVIRDGRFGPYVTDGEVNASLRKSDDVETITDERAAELLAEKRAKGPSTKRPTRGANGTRRKATTKS